MSLERRRYPRVAVAILWHLALFKSYYDGLGIFGRKEPLVHLGMLENLIKAVFMTYIYPMGYQGGGPVTEGLRFGVFIGILVGSTWVLGTAALQPIGSLSTWLLIDGSFNVAQHAMAGILIGLVYGKSVKWWETTPENGRYVLYALRTGRHWKGNGLPAGEKTRFRFVAVRW